MDQTSGSVDQCSPVQCSPTSGNEMILYFSVLLVEKLEGGGGGGAEPLPPNPQSEQLEGQSPPISPPLF